MAKANLKTPDGISINIEGSIEEIDKIIKLYQGEGRPIISDNLNSKKQRKQEKNTKQSNDYITQIINKIKDCGEAEKIEKTVLDQTSQVNKILLPLYIIYKYLNNSIELQSGDINKITQQLSIPIATPNVSNVLSGSGSRYVMGDKVRKHGQPVKYKLNRRGSQYFEAVLNAKTNE